VTGAWVLVAAVVAATVIGVTLRRRDGRFRPARRRLAAEQPTPAEPSPSVTALPVTADEAPAADEAPVTAAAPVPEPRSAPGVGALAGELASLGRTTGDRATLLQFSTAFCGPCRTARAVLADVARIVPGVVHVEVDAEANLELVRRLGIRRTPTVLVLDGDAREISRASGAPPSRAAVIAALGPIATETSPTETSRSETSRSEPRPTEP
jgi:thiol-disulfide isomerase/thioredoxin